MGYNGVWWRCEICEAYLPNEPAVTLHFLEKHDDNILLREDVRLEPLRIILPRKTEFWSGVKLSRVDVSLSEEDICGEDQEFDDDGHDEEGDDEIGEFPDRDDSNWIPPGEEIIHESEDRYNEEDDDQDDDEDDQSYKDESPDVDVSGKMVPPPPSPIVHTCYICAATFPTKQKLKTHRKTHRGQKPYSCDTCDKTFAIYTFCEMHKLEHTPEWPELRKNPKKLAEIKKQFMLQRRKWRMQLYQPPVIKQCPECPRTFKWATTLRRHLRWHRNERPFICTTCGSSYRCNNTLQVHLRSGKCSKVILTSFSRAFQCEVCPARLKSKNGLRSHKKNMHGLSHKPRVKQNHACPQCNYVTKCASTLQNHLNSHSGIRPFPCPAECGASFTLRSNMLAHVRNNCPVAKKSGLAEEYQEQKEEATSNRNCKWGKVPGGISCTECNKIFSSLGQLEVHSRTHGSGKYGCDLCGAGYEHKATLNLHRKGAHPEILVVPCEQCGERFEDAERMKSHGRMVHRKMIRGEQMTKSTVLIQEVELEGDWRAGGFVKAVDPLGGCE